MGPLKADRLRIVTLGYLGLIIALAILPPLFREPLPLVTAYVLLFPHILFLPGAVMIAGWALLRKRRVDCLLALLCAP